MAGTPRYRKALLIAYVLALLLGISASALGIYTYESAIAIDRSLLAALWGILSGMLFMGAGALFPIFLIGTLLPVYPQTALPAFAFLYGASAGMYLSLYYLERLETGLAMDETLKHNFKIRAVEALLISVIPAILRTGV